MTDCDNSHDSLFIVNLVSNPPIADTNSPASLFAFDLKTAMRTRIIRESEGY